MANVKNNHDAVLSVGGVSIRPGATVAVPGWSEDLASPKERSLLDAELIEVEERAKAVETNKDLESSAEKSGKKS